MYATVHWTSNFLQGTRRTRPCFTGHPVEDAHFCAFCKLIFHGKIQRNGENYFAIFTISENAGEMEIEAREISYQGEKEKKKLVKTLIPGHSRKVRGPKLY